jgi:transcriptional regulator with XRE-family HTH domain
MGDLGPTLRRARTAAGVSLAGMARRTGYSRSYLGNVETGVRRATPALVRAYERVLGDDVNRRSLLIGTAAAAATAALPAGSLPGAAPDLAADLVRDIAAERTGYLSTVVTSHATDRMIGSLVARDTASIASLSTWMRRGSPILRANSTGILAKVGSPVLNETVVRTLKADGEARQIYLTAVVNRLLGLPWDEAGKLARQGLQDDGQVARVAAELANPYDSGARWCSMYLLARTRPDDPGTVDEALRRMLKTETSREMLRCVAGTLAGLDPLTV